MQITNNISDMKRKSTKILAIVVCAVILTGCLSAVLYVHCIKNGADYVNFDRNKLKDSCSTITILDSEGNEIKEATSLDDSRQIPLAALPEYTYMAFVAVEDKRFFEHNGIDVKRVAGAAIHNAMSGSFKEGASTISQQLIKNTHLSNNKTIKRKVNEMLLARQLESNYSKHEILQMYLNTIYFGRNAYGIENAANVYFDKSAADLTVAESATLAGMIKAPNIYAPDKNSEKSKSRRNTVLKLMREQNIIDEKQYLQALESEIVYQPYKNKQEKTYVSRVTEEACRLLNMTEAQLFRSGVVIQTYMQPEVQNSLYKLAGEDCTENIDGTISDLSCVICDKEGGVAACYFRGENALSQKQIGSTAKPLAVYAPALDRKLITQASPVLDEPINYSGYQPTNANGYNGWTTIKYAVSKSLNVPAVKTLNSLGVENAETYLKKLGFNEKQDLTLALGNVAGGMNVHQLANGYATLANGGISNGVSYVKCIFGANGLIYSRKLENTRVYSAKAAYLMTDMLKNAVSDGTAKAIGTANVISAAKTGTVGNSAGNTDALVAGYTSQHTYVFWYSGNLPNKINGGTTPCKLAANVLKKMYRNAKPQDFAVPSGITELTVDKDSLYTQQLVKLATSGESFVFDECNCPTDYVRAEKMNYKLETKSVNGKMFLLLPEVDGCVWKIFKQEKDGDMAISDTVVSEGIFYAELWNESNCIYTTPKLEINIPKSQKVRTALNNGAVNTVSRVLGDVAVNTAA